MKVIKYINILKVIVYGDFKVHVCCSSASYVSLELINLLGCFNFTQLVKNPTHVHTSLTLFLRMGFILTILIEILNSSTYEADCLSKWFLKAIMDTVCQDILIIGNHSLAPGMFLSDFRHATVYPLLKQNVLRC